eukprot:UN17430
MLRRIMNMHTLERDIKMYCTPCFECIYFDTLTCLFFPNLLTLANDPVLSRPQIDSLVFLHCLRDT